MTSDRDAMTPVPPLTSEAIAKLRKLYAQATPLESMPGPFDEDRRYSDREIASLEADKELRRALPALLDTAEVQARLVGEQGCVCGDCGARLGWVRMPSGGHSLMCPTCEIKALRKRVEVLERFRQSIVDMNATGLLGSCLRLGAALAAAEGEET